MIAAEQNSPLQLERLAAQRQLYSTAKRVFSTLIILSGPGAVVSAVIGLIWPNLKGYSALFGISVALCDVLWLTPWQKLLRERAARVQEEFDCDVLQLPWNSVKVGHRPDPELIKEQSGRYALRAERMPTLRDWYAPSVSQLPLHLGRIVCQRSNCWWDAKQRRRYAVIIISLVFFICGLVLCVALQRQLSLEQFVVSVVAPLAPLLILGVRQLTEQLEAAKRLDALKDHAQQLWTDALVGKVEADITATSRLLQDEVFDNRRKSPLVFDRIFRWLRNDFENQMNYGAAALIAEAKKAGW